MKILLVDDSRAIAMVTMARLESFGYDVIHAMDGQQGIELFSRGGIDLILMDIEMPGMNGFETTTRIRAIEGTEPWAWTPIIFVTATDTNTNLVMAIEAGGDDFISKSAPENVLQAKMKAMNRIAALRERLAVANGKLQDQANHDGLTGLLNRRAMDLRVDALWEKAKAGSAPFALLMIDIDNFKKYNDFYGHPAGDECLRKVAACLHLLVGQANDEGLAHDAFVARYGGEEFCVVLPEFGKDAPVVLAERLVQAVAGLDIEHQRNEAYGKVTISVGAGSTEHAVEPIKALFRQADALLYQAKRNGRNRQESCLLTPA